VNELKDARAAQKISHQALSARNKELQDEVESLKVVLKISHR